MFRLSSLFLSLGRYSCLYFLLGVSAYAAEGAKDGGWVSLFNGKDLTGWSKTIRGYKVGEDPDKLVQVHDGMIHMYKDLDTKAVAPFGIITHQDTFSRFHLKLQYRWLEKKFKPRANALRDAGLLYHVVNPDKVWPHSVECQIQEGDTGDIVLLYTGGVSWKHSDPDSALAGQGDPSQLPEAGGYPSYFYDWAYLGRLPEADHLKDWTTVEVIVQADESAVHIINGQLIARVSHMENGHGVRLKSGKISLQLEGAELVYKDIQIKKLAEPLRVSQQLVAMSAVVGVPSQAQTITITNPHSYEVVCKPVLNGKDTKLFKLGEFPDKLAAGESRKLTVQFTPDTKISAAGRFSAGVQIGDLTTGTHVILQGIGLKKFEGANEPTLEMITRACGVPVDVGGGELHLDTVKAKIGASVEASYFKAVEGKKAVITPLARFSPRGLVDIGMFRKGAPDLVKLGELSNVGDKAPDAHQRLLPPLVSGAKSIEAAVGDGAFGVYIKGKDYLVATDCDRSKGSKVEHGVRVYPVKFFQGRRLNHAYLLGFEEARNGDYQDTLLLIENVVAE